VQIRNANAANYYECARMKEKKQQDLFGKRLTDFRLVRNGSQRFSMVLNGSERCSMVLNGCEWLRMVANGTAWFRPSGKDRQDRERECDESQRIRANETKAKMQEIAKERLTGLGPFAKLCETLPNFANLCETLRIFANRCESLRFFAFRCVPARRQAEHGTRREGLGSWWQLLTC